MWAELSVTDWTGFGICVANLRNCFDFISNLFYPVFLCNLMSRSTVLHEVMSLLKALIFGILDVYRQTG